MMNLNALKIDPEFQGKIPPLNFEEEQQLEQNILHEGRLLNPIIIWNGFILDGHTRYRILRKHPLIAYQIQEIELDNRYAALSWICQNQLGRRNLDPERKKFLMGKLYESEKLARGGSKERAHDENGRFTSMVQNDPLRAKRLSTCERIAAQNGVGPATVKRAEKYTVKEVRPRYSCFYKVRHPGDCDGQSGYGVSKLDSIVEEVVRQIFAQFREVSRKKLLESVKTNDAARIQKKIKKIQKDLEAKQKELDDLKAETILVIRGVSALDKELLGTLVAEAREALETLEKQLVQAQEEYEEATKTAKRSNYICNELFTWADVYDTANHDERRAILQQFIEEIRVRKDYEISITLNASFNQVEQLKAVSTYDGAEIFEEISEKGA